MGHKVDSCNTDLHKLFYTPTPDENYEGLCESACTQKPIDKDVYLASISQDAISDGDEVYETVSRLTSTEVLNNQLKRLSAKEKLVLMERNGFYGEPKTLEQVGQILNVTRERVRQIEIKAIKKLRIKLRRRGYNENGNSTSIGGFGRQSSTDIKDETVLYRLGDDLIHATGFVFDGGFLVHKGTEFTGHETLSLSIEYRVLRRELVNEGYIKNNVFVKDYVFNDKREAAIALLGRMVSRKAAKTLWDAGNPKTKVADNLTDTLVINLSQDNKNTDQTKESETVPNGGNEGGNAATDGEVGNPLPTDSKDETVVYRLNDDWIQATGSIVDEGFLVHEKADFSGAEARAIARKYHDLRRKLLNEGCVKNNVFVKNHVFKSKYEAAIVLLGRHVSEKVAETLWIAEDSKPEVVDNLVDTSVIIQAKDNETDRSSLPSRKLYQETLMFEDPENSKSEVAVISPDKNSQSSNLKKDVLYLKGSWIHATGSNIYRGFLVHKGAGFARIESILIENRYHSLRKKLIDKGYVKNNVFVKNYVFNDKREAAIVLLGRNIPEEAERVLWFATGSYKV
ncbi:sigma factor-like helix-turn-helix DNA-binding protein [Dialister sp.]